jgi:predicted DNA-binding transcriptional regulator AlpA
MKTHMNMNYHGELPTEGFVSLPVVLRVLSIGKTSWWNGIREGKYPKPSKFGSKTSRWHVDDIRALIAKFKAQAGNNVQPVQNEEE